LKSKPSQLHYDLLARHVIATLPTDIGKRRTLLVTLLASLPRDFHWRHEILLMLEAIRAHEKAQLDFLSIHPEVQS
jgi:hypothetical protein